MTDPNNTTIPPGSPLEGPSYPPLVGISPDITQRLPPLGNSPFPAVAAAAVAAAAVDGVSEPNILPAVAAVAENLVDSGEKRGARRNDEKRNTKWNTMYERLVAYWTLKSHCRVNHSEDRQLYDWVQEQRKMYDQGKMDQGKMYEDRRQLLERVDFDFKVGDSRDELWNHNYLKLKEYFVSKGCLHCRVSNNEDKQLATWCIRQRLAFRNGKLSQERKSKLDDLAFEFVVREDMDTKGPDKGKATPNQEEAWNAMFAKLCAYQRKYGHCRVPDKWKEDPQLARWTTLQRHTAKHGKIMQSRLSKLSAIGFTQNIRKAPDNGEKTFAAPQQDITILVDKREMNQSPDRNDVSVQQKGSTCEESNLADCGKQLTEKSTDKGEMRQAKESDTLVSNGASNDKEDVTEALNKLYSSGKKVVSAKRQQQQEHASEASDTSQASRKHRQPQLQRIDPAKRPKTGRCWNESFEALLNFKQAHGHVRVPRRYESDKPLGRWVIHQRALELQGSLQDDLRDRLDAIGFVWSKKPRPAPTTMTPEPDRKPKRRTWDENYNRLLQYKQKYGNADVPRGYPEDPRLASWVRNQRSQREGLSEEQTKLLDELSFSWLLGSSDHQATWESHFEQLKQFHDVHGHCNPRQLDKEYKGLGPWVQNQRREAANLADEQRSKLDSLGFSWSIRKPAARDTSKLDKLWLLKFDKLVEFKQMYNHTSPPENYLRAPKLKEWVGAQRRAGRVGRLREDRKKMLESISFDFEQQTTWWLE